MEDLTESEIEDARGLADQLDRLAKYWIRHRRFLLIVPIVPFGLACWIWREVFQSMMAFPEHLIDSPPNPPIDHMLLLSQLRYEFINLTSAGCLLAIGVIFLITIIARWNRDKKDRLLARLIRSHLALQETDRDRSNT